MVEVIAMDGNKKMKVEMGGEDGMEDWGGGVGRRDGGGHGGWRRVIEDGEVGRVGGTGVVA
jgi:hypothetical protein